MERYVRTTDITEYLFCPRKVYLKRVLGLKEEKKEVMVKGSIIHKAFELFNDREEKIVYEILDTLPFDGILKIYEEYIDDIIREAIAEFKGDLEDLGIDEETIFVEVKSHMWEDVVERAKNVYRTVMDKKVYGIFLWDVLEPKIKTEIELLSSKYQLVGRLDRLELYKTIAIPIEIKSGNFNKDHTLQLHSYFLLLKENFPKYNVPYGIVYYTKHKKRKEVKINPNKISFVLKIKDKVLEIIEDGREPPKLKDYNKCKKCPFFDICWRGNVQNY